MAEGVGFEPTIRLPVYTLSNRAPSATRPSLQFHTGSRRNMDGSTLSASDSADDLPVRGLQRRRPRTSEAGVLRSRQADLSFVAMPHLPCNVALRRLKSELAHTGATQPCLEGDD